MGRASRRRKKCGGAKRQTARNDLTGKELFRGAAQPTKLHIQLRKWQHAAFLHTCNCIYLLLCMYICVFMQHTGICIAHELYAYKQRLVSI